MLSNHTSQLKESQQRTPLDIAAHAPHSSRQTPCGHRRPGRPSASQLAGQDSAARQQLFNQISPVYDQFNDLLSLGQHRVWKQAAVTWSDAPRGGTVLDLCCGSGDLALALARQVGPKGKVVGLDFAAEMLRDAGRRESQQASTARASVEWVQGDALDLPLRSGHYDAATMGYGLRNVVDRPRALAEAHRVLKPGARLVVLDFNNTQDPLTDAVQAFCLEQLVVPLARGAGLGPEYEYLRPSIKAYPPGDGLVQLAREAGFTKAVFHETGFGLMGILVATKGPGSQ